MSDVSTPVDLGPYRLDKLLASGASAQVWLARGPKGEVALKIARSEAHRAALLREAHALEAAQHPHIVRMLDAAPDGRWLALERVKGTLVDRWAAKRPVAEVVRVVAELLEAVKHLHAQGIVHGDIKPSNVLVDRANRVKLLDLGIATLAGDEVKGFRGTLGYAAPELLRGEPCGRRCDVYGVGALLYTCLTDRKPFEVPDPAALTYVPLVSLPAPPSTWREGIPSALDATVLELLARDKTRRPKSLPRIQKSLLAALKSPMQMPVLGMHDERDLVRQAVVGATDGECRVVVVYGPPGCGRQTLIGEGVDAGLREGLEYIDDPSRLGHTAAPPILTLEASDESAALLVRIATSRMPGLFLLRAPRPLPELEARAVQLTPPPLCEEDAIRLVAFLEGDPVQAAVWWRESLGHPIALIGRVRAWRRLRTGAAPDLTLLPPPSRAVLEWLRAHGTSPISAIAAALAMGEHTLLDHCEVLFAEQLIAADADGANIAPAIDPPAG